jgi:hypothetical protein
MTASVQGIEDWIADPSARFMPSAEMKTGLLESMAYARALPAAVTGDDARRRFMKKS